MDLTAKPPQSASGPALPVAKRRSPGDHNSADLTHSSSKWEQVWRIRPVPGPDAKFSPADRPLPKYGVLIW